MGSELAELVIPPSRASTPRRVRRSWRPARARCSAGRAESMRADDGGVLRRAAINLVASPTASCSRAPCARRSPPGGAGARCARLEQVARLRNPGPRPAAGDPQRRCRRGDGAGARRPAPVRQRRRPRAARLRVVRGAAGGPGDWMRDRFEILDETATRCPPRSCGRRALAGEARAEAVVRFRLRATGEERWSAVKATPILDEDGFVTMAINVIEDITTHKRAERRAALPADSSALLGASRAHRGARAGRDAGGARGGRLGGGPCPARPESSWSRWRTATRSS